VSEAARTREFSVAANHLICFTACPRCGFELRLTSMSYMRFIGSPAAEQHDVWTSEASVQCGQCQEILQMQYLYTVSNQKRLRTVPPVPGPDTPGDKGSNGLPNLGEDQTASGNQ
jgi:hypothetical protein